MSTLRTSQKTHRKGKETKPYVSIPRYLHKMKLDKCKHNILLHKYGHIYLSKVFKNVRPSDATRHYERRLLRGAFCRWKLLWWHQQQQWRLTLRANCYHRFILLKQSWAGWREYIARKHLARHREVQAQRHYETTVLTRCLTGFKQHSELLKNLRINASIRLEILLIVKAKQNCLHLMHKLITRRVDELACALWNNKSLKKYWEHWMQYSQRQKVKKAKITCAQQMYRSKLQHMAFEKWQKYIDMKRTKQMVLKIADQTYMENLLSNHLLVWKERYQHVIWEKHLSKKVKELYNHKVLHSCFLAWSIFAKEKSKDRVADQHYNRVTMTKALKCLKEYADYMSEWRLAKQRLMLKRAWDLWTACVEQSQLQQVWPQVEMARAFYRKKLLENSLRMLKAYTDKRKKKTKLRIKAEMFLSLQYVQLWYNQWQENQYVASLEKQAVAFHQLSCLKNTLSTWEERYYEVVYQKELEENAGHYYIHNLVKKCFLAWETWAGNSTQNRRLREEVHVLHCQRVQKMYFHFWRLETQQKRCKRRKMHDATQHYKQSLIRKAWTSWTLFHRCKTSEAERMRKLEARVWKAKLRRILVGWLAYTKERLTRKKKMDASIQHYKLAIVIKAWDGWLYYMEYRQQKRSSKRKYQQPADQLKAVMMSGYFHNWFELTSKLQRAKRHYQRRLMRKCLLGWRGHSAEQVELRQRKERLRLVSKAMVFMRCLKVWRFRLSQQLEVKRQEMIALVFWSNKLQRQCFTRWIDYVHRQREEMKRYMDALETQRATLLQEGFKAWMRADLVAAVERETTALEYVTQRARRDFHVASKYFARWKLKVRRKRKDLKTTRCRHDNVLTMADMRRTYRAVLEAPIILQTAREADSIVGPITTYQTHSQSFVAPVQSDRVVDNLPPNRKRPQPRIPLFMTTNSITTDNSWNNVAVRYDITNYRDVQ